jgi:hypothetical protein
LADINDIHRFYEANLPGYKRKHVIECNKFFLGEMGEFWKKPINDVLNKFDKFKRFVCFDWHGAREIRTKRLPPQEEQKSSFSITEPCSCGGHMVKRQNRSDHSFFYGCSRYPKCKNTQPYLD